MKRVLSELEITGVITNQAFLYELVTSDRFKQGTYSTSFIENDVLAGRRGLNAAKSV
jgi:acetyl-CoA carboxylase biotin carboxylase subunit